MLREVMNDVETRSHHEEFLGPKIPLPKVQRLSPEIRPESAFDATQLKTDLSTAGAGSHLHLAGPRLNASIGEHHGFSRRI